MDTVQVLKESAKKRAKYYKDYEVKELALVFLSPEMSDFEKREVAISDAFVSDILKEEQGLRFGF